MRTKTSRFPHTRSAPGCQPFFSLFLLYAPLSQHTCNAFAVDEQKMHTVHFEHCIRTSTSTTFSLSLVGYTPPLSTILTLHSLKNLLVKKLQKKNKVKTWKMQLNRFRALSMPHSRRALCPHWKHTHTHTNTCTHKLNTELHTQWRTLL